MAPRYASICRVREEEDVVTDTEPGPVTGGSETVLVVEDDEDVRGTVVELLSELGYRVLKAKDAQSALAIVESGVPIDALFSDVVMPGPLRSPELDRKARERLPGRSGIDLAEVARQRQPSLRVIFVSGYYAGSQLKQKTGLSDITYLQKPYSRESLANALAEAAG
jgi:CheY-like chemotaxis protein